ncbi:MAG: hypothetical protein ACTS46_01255 [Candidatus Hodgkinia cicadicola]
MCLSISDVGYVSFVNKFVSKFIPRLNWGGRNRLISNEIGLTETWISAQSRANDQNIKQWALT